MKKLRLKKSALFGIYAGVCVLLLGVVYYIDFSHNKLENQKPDDDYRYVSRLFGEEDMPVVSTDEKIMRPYTDESVKIVQNFYDYKASEKDQENSIINYEQTYIQNSGVAYGGVENGFDAISALPGTVTSVKEDKLLGTIVEIQTNDKVVAVYQGLTDVKVKENDKINQGDIIGKSGETNLGKDLGKHIVFILKINGVNVNPEAYYDKNINEL